jgi:hypothetical protein
MKSRPDVAVKEGTEDIAVVNAAAEVKVAEGQGMSRKRTDRRMLVALTGGQQIEYHTSFNFPRHIIINMTPEGTETLKRERQSTHHKTRSSQTAIQELALFSSPRTRRNVRKSELSADGQHLRVTKL